MLYRMADDGETERSDVFHEKDFSLDRRITEDVCESMEKIIAARRSPFCRGDEEGGREPPLVSW